METGGGLDISTLFTVFNQLLVEGGVVVLVLILVALHELQQGTELESDALQSRDKV